MSDGFEDDTLFSPMEAAILDSVGNGNTRRSKSFFTNMIHFSLAPKTKSLSDSLLWSAFTNIAAIQNEDLVNISERRTYRWLLQYLAPAAPDSATLLSLKYGEEKTIIKHAVACAILSGQTNLPQGREVLFTTPKETPWTIVDPILLCTFKGNENKERCRLDTDFHLDSDLVFTWCGVCKAMSVASDSTLAVQLLWPAFRYTVPRHGRNDPNAPSRSMLTGSLVDCDLNKNASKD